MVGAGISCRRRGRLVGEGWWLGEGVWGVGGRRLPLVTDKTPTRCRLLWMIPAAAELEAAAVDGVAWSSSSDASPALMAVPGSSLMYVSAGAGTSVEAGTSFGGGARRGTPPHRQGRSSRQ